jgi:hypothetical protein
MCKCIFCKVIFSNTTEWSAAMLLSLRKPRLHTSSQRRKQPTADSKCHDDLPLHHWRTRLFSTATEADVTRLKVSFGGSVPRPAGASTLICIDWDSPHIKLLARVRIRVGKEYQREHKDAPVHYVHLHKDGGHIVISDPFWTEVDVLGDGKQPEANISFDNESLYYDNWQAYWIIRV